jgi:hypothetical protein
MSDEFELEKYTRLSDEERKLLSTPRPPLSDEDRKLLSTSEAELRNSVRTPCFDLDQYNSRVTGERWQQLIQSHLYYDHVISTLLTEHLVNPEAINASRMGFAQKLDLIEALGLIPQDEVSAVKVVNKLRNKIAHDLSFQISEKDEIDLYNCLPDSLKRDTKILQARVSAEQFFIEMLSSLLCLIEIRRQQHSLNKLYSKKLGAEARAVLLARQTIFNPHGPKGDT